MMSMTSDIIRWCIYTWIHGERYIHRAYIQTYLLFNLDCAWAQRSDSYSKGYNLSGVACPGFESGGLRKGRLMLHKYTHTYVRTYIHTYLHICYLIFHCAYWHREVISNREETNCLPLVRVGFEPRSGTNTLFSRRNVRSQSDWVIEVQAETWSR